MCHLITACNHHAVLTLATVIERLLALSMGGTKVLQDCYISLMESCIHLKDVEEDGDDDDADGAEDLDDDDEEEDTDDDDEVMDHRTGFSIFSLSSTHCLKDHEHAIRIRRMMMCEKRQKRNSLQDMRLLLVSQSRLSRKET